MANDERPPPPAYSPIAGISPEDAADELTRTVGSILSAGICGTTGPGRTIVAMRIALNAVKAALVTKGMLSAEQADYAERFAEASVSSDSGGAAAEVAIETIDLHTNTALCSPENLAETLKEAEACLHLLEERGQVSPVTQLVILYAARELATAVLKDQEPDGYFRLLAISRAMENAIRPARVVVTHLPIRHMSKGGSA